MKVDLRGDPSSLARLAEKKMKVLTPEDGARVKISN
jgi:hypothetical protein